MPSRSSASPYACRHPAGRKRCLLAPAHTQKSQLAHGKSPSEQQKKAAVALNHHTTRRPWSRAVGLGSLVLHGQLAMEHRERQANREGPTPPRRVVIEHHAADAGWAARVLPMPVPSSSCPGTWCVGWAKKRRSTGSAYLYPKIRYSWSSDCQPRVPGIAAILRRTDAVDISLVVSVTRCSPEHKVCKKRKTRNAKIHICQKLS